MRLIIVRHAKSSWQQAGISDFERPLAPRGQHDAPLIAADMAARGLRPALFLVSAAQRTRETLGFFLRIFSHDSVLRIDNALYDGDRDGYIDRVNELTDAYGDILLLGHNPSVQDAALLLAGTGKEPDLSRMANKFPTGAYAVLSFAAAIAQPGAGHLDCFVEPRNLAA